MSLEPATSGWLHELTLLAFVLHIGAGSIALVSGVAAICSRKGGALHRKAGNAFFYSMMVMALFATYLAVVIPGQFWNVLGSLFAAYLVATAWTTIRREEGASGLPEKFALLVALCLCAPLALLSIELATGMDPLFKSSTPIRGPGLIALYSITFLLLIAAIGDARLVWAGGSYGVSRIARHLWRMCLGLTLATGSAFTNGIARLLPGPYHVPPAFFFPQFIPMIVMMFWLIRMWFTKLTKQPKALDLA